MISSDQGNGLPIRRVCRTGLQSRWSAVWAFLLLGTICFGRAREPVAQGRPAGNASATTKATRPAGQLSANSDLAELLRALDQKEHYTQLEAMRFLSARSDPAMVEPLIRVFEEAGGDMKAMAAEILGRLGDSRAIEPLSRWIAYSPQAAGRYLYGPQPFISKQDLGVMRNTALALGQIGEARVIPSLFSALDWPTVTVRESVIEALTMIQLKTDGYPLVVPLAGGWSWIKRLHGLRVLTRDPEWMTWSYLMAIYQVLVRPAQLTFSAGIVLVVAFLVLAFQGITNTLSVLGKGGWLLLLTIAVAGIQYVGCVSLSLGGLVFLLALVWLPLLVVFAGLQTARLGQRHEIARATGFLCPVDWHRFQRGPLISGLANWSARWLVRERDPRFRDLAEYQVCRCCGGQRRWEEIQDVILVLDASSVEKPACKDGRVVINGLLYPASFDFEWAEIRLAADEQVLDFLDRAQQDPALKARCQQVACLVDANCVLSNETQMALRRTFGGLKLGVQLQRE